MFRLPPPDRTLAARRRRGHSRIAAQRLAIDALGRRAHRRSARAGTLGLGLQVHARIAHLALELTISLVLLELTHDRRRDAAHPRHREPIIPRLST